MPYSFISGNCEDDTGKTLAKFWENETKIKLNAPYSVIGIVDLNKELIKGVVLFTEYTGSNVDLHFVGCRCLNRTTIKYILNYVFNELKCNVLRVKLHSTDKKIVDYVKRLGFEYECVLDEYYSLEDHAIVYKMYKDKSKAWIKLNVAA